MKLTIDIGQDLLAQLRNEAARAGMTPEAYAVQILTQHLSQQTAVVPKDEKPDLEGYKTRITAEFNRTGGWGVPEEPNLLAAHRAINDYRRLSGDIAGVLDLQLTMVEGGTDYTLRLGDLEESYYEAIEMVMEDFVTLAKEYPDALAQTNLTRRLDKLAQRAADIGWGYGDNIDQMVGEVILLMDGG